MPKTYKYSGIYAFVTKETSRNRTTYIEEENNCF